MELLKGRTAVVYGASGMLGERIATELFVQGATVVLHCFSNTQRAEAVAARLDPSGERTMVIRADCKSEAETDRLIAEVVDRFGRVDTVVNTVHPPFDPVAVADAKDTDWNLHIDALMSGFHIFKSAISVMRKQQYGRLIFISAAMAVRYGEGCSMYSAIKRGMNGFCRTLAIEEGRNNILVNIVCPGGVSDAVTETGEDWEEKSKEFIARCALGRFATAREVANTVVYFASELADGITGQTLYVSGGEIMQ